MGSTDRWSTQKRERICPCGVYVEDDGAGCGCSPWGFAVCALFEASQGTETAGRTAEELRDWALDAWTASEFGEALHRLRDAGALEVSGFLGSAPIYALTGETLAAFRLDENTAYEAVAACLGQSPQHSTGGAG